MSGSTPTPGKAQFPSDFQDLEVEEQTVVVLLYRRAAKELGELETAGMMDTWFEEDFGIRMRTAEDVCERLPFVTEENETYLIQPIDVGAAIDWLDDR